MLDNDRKILGERFPAVEMHLLCAELRAEMYLYLKQTIQLDEYQRKRMEELELCSACRKPWFLKKF